MVNDSKVGGVPEQGLREVARDADALALLRRLLDTMLANYDALSTESRDDYVRGDVLPLRMSTAFWLDLRAALERPRPTPDDQSGGEYCNGCGKPAFRCECVRAALPAEHAPPAFVGVDQKPDGCWFACIASLTGIPLGEFPEPPHGEVEASVVRNTVTKLLHAHGWQMHRVWTIPGAVPRGWAIAGGTSLRNAAHAVVVYDGELVWDPHPSRAGLVAIEEYEIVVPVRAGNALPVGSRPALAGSPDQLAELAKDFFASWQNPPPNSVHAVTEFIDYMRGRVSGTQEGTTKP